MSGSVPRRRSVVRAISSDLPSIHARFGDGLDGRRQIGRNPAEGDVGSADAPRELRQAPPTYEPDEARGPVLGEKTLPFLAGEAELVDRRLVHVVLVRAITSRHDGPCSGSGGAWVMRIAPSSACSVGGQQPCRPRGSLPRQESSARSTTSRSRSWQRHDAAAGVRTIAYLSWPVVSRPWCVCLWWWGCLCEGRPLVVDGRRKGGRVRVWLRGRPCLSGPAAASVCGR